MTPVFWNSVKAVLLAVLTALLDHLTGTGKSNGTDQPNL